MAAHSTCTREHGHQGPDGSLSKLQKEDFLSVLSWRAAGTQVGCGILLGWFGAARLQTPW